MLIINKKLRILVGILLLLVFVTGMSAISASNQSLTKTSDKTTKNVSVKKTEPLKTIYPTGKNHPKKIKINSSHIYVWGAKCSCGRAGHYNRHGVVVFKNQNPSTKKWGWITTKGLNPKGVGDYELTSKDDRDICIADGYEKWRPARVKLAKWSSNSLKNDKILYPNKKATTSKNKVTPQKVKINKTDILIKGATFKNKKKYDIHIKNYFKGKWGTIKYKNGLKSKYKKGLNRINGVLYSIQKGKFYNMDFNIFSGKSIKYNGKYKLKLVNINPSK